MTHADRAHSGIRFLPECVVVAPAEHLRLRGDLRMDFEADNRFELGHGKSLTAAQ